MFKWAKGCQWVHDRHRLTTPAIFPLRKVAQLKLHAAGGTAQGLSPSFVHFKIHDFGNYALSIVHTPSGDIRMEFNKSGFGTALAGDRSVPFFRVNQSKPALEQAFAYFQEAKREPVPIDDRIASYCSWHNALLGCSLPWVVDATFPITNDQG